VAPTGNSELLAGKHPDVTGAAPPVTVGAVYVTPIGCPLVDTIV
jgi:hypothetical protein